MDNRPVDSIETAQPPKALHHTVQTIHHSLCHLISKNMSDYSNELLWEDKDKFILREVSDSDPEDIRLLKHNLIIFNSLSPLIRKINNIIAGGKIAKTVNGISLLNELYILYTHVSAIVAMTQEPESQLMASIQKLQDSLATIDSSKLISSQAKAIFQGNTEELEKLYDNIYHQIQIYFQPPVLATTNDGETEKKELTAFTICLDQLKQRLEHLEDMNLWEVQLKNAPLKKDGAYKINKKEDDAITSAIKSGYNLLFYIKTLYDPPIDRKSPQFIATCLKILKAYSQIDWEKAPIELKTQLDGMHTNLLLYLKEEYLPQLKKNAGLIYELEKNYHLKPGTLSSKANDLVAQVEEWYADNGIYLPNPLINIDYIHALEKKMPDEEYKKNIRQVNKDLSYIIHVLNNKVDSEDIYYREKMLIALTHLSASEIKSDSATHINTAQDYFIQLLTLKEKQDLLAILTGEKNIDAQQEKYGILENSHYDYSGLKEKLTASINLTNNRWWFTNVAFDVANAAYLSFYYNKPELIPLLQLANNAQKDLIPIVREITEAEEQLSYLQKQLETQKIQSALNLLRNRDFIHLVNAAKQAKNDPQKNIAEKNRLAIIFANAFDKNPEEFIDASHAKVNDYIETPEQLEACLSNLFIKSAHQKDKILCHNLTTQLIIAGEIDPAQENIKAILNYNETAFKDKELEKQQIHHCCTDALTKIDVHNLINIINHAAIKDPQAITQLAAFNLAIKQQPINSETLAAESALTSIEKYTVKNLEINRENILKNLETLYKNSNPDMQKQIGSLMANFAANDKDFSILISENKNYRSIIQNIEATSEEKKTLLKEQRAKEQELNNLLKQTAQLLTNYVTEKEQRKFFFYFFPTKSNPLRRKRINIVKKHLETIQTMQKSVTPLSHEEIEKLIIQLKKDCEMLQDKKPSLGKLSKHIKIIEKENTSPKFK